MTEGTVTFIVTDNVRLPKGKGTVKDGVTKHTHTHTPFNRFTIMLRSHYANYKPPR